MSDLVLDVRDGDGHRLGRVADRTALGDIGVRLELRQALGRLHGQNGAGERRLAVVDVTDGADVARAASFVEMFPWPFFLPAIIQAVSKSCIQYMLRFDRDGHAKSC